MAYDEVDLLPISALQHLLFCERQAALIHVEKQWKDNHLTLEGAHLHRKVDSSAQRREVRGDVVIVRGLALRCLAHGLVGRADVVEFHRVCPGASQTPLPAEESTALPGLGGRWTPFPVEYKRGKPKSGRCDEVQLCAQALCLEERLSLVVHEGALFYGRNQRRSTVRFDEALRKATIGAAQRFRQIIRGAVTPTAERTAKCERCSLLDLCLPGLARAQSAESYLRNAISDAKASEEEPPCGNT